MNHHKKEPWWLAEQIANTCDTTRPEPESLRRPADLGEYLQRWSIPVAQEPTAQDLAEVLDLRHHLRAVFEAGDLTVAAGVLNELLSGIHVRPHVGLLPDGRLDLELVIEEELPIARRLGAQAALGLQAGLAQYGIERFHVCNAAPCTEVFVDTSRNHTRRYCCQQCATRQNMAAFRQRQRQA